MRRDGLTTRSVGKRMAPVMRAVLILALAIAAAVATAGCGDDDGGNGTDESKAPATTEAAQEPPPAPAEPTTGADKFSGESASVYSDANALCSAFPPEKIARDLGIQADTSTSEGIVSIAEAFAEGYRGDVHQAAFEGCLDALPNPSG
jgi:hypothetical protein